MRLRTAYTMLGLSGLIIGFDQLIPTSSTQSNTGLSCLSNLIGLAYLTLLIISIIVIYRKRKKLSPKMENGAKVGLVGLIGFGVVMVVLIVVIIAIVGSIMTNMMNSEESEPKFIMEFLDWIFIIEIIGFFSVVLTIMVYGGPCFWSEKKISKRLTFAGAILLVMLHIITIIVMNGVVENVRETYKDNDESDQDVIVDIQSDLSPWHLNVLKAITSVPYFFFAIAAFITGRNLDLPQYDRPRDHYGTPFTHNYNSATSAPRYMTCPNCARPINRDLVRCYFCGYPLSPATHYPHTPKYPPSQL